MLHRQGDGWCFQHDSGIPSVSWEMTTMTKLSSSWKGGGWNNSMLWDWIWWWEPVGAGLRHLKPASASFLSWIEKPTLLIQGFFFSFFFFVFFFLFHYQKVGCHNEDCWQCEELSARFIIHLPEAPPSTPLFSLGLRIFIFFYFLFGRLWRPTNLVFHKKRKDRKKIDSFFLGLP